MAFNVSKLIDETVSVSFSYTHESTGEVGEINALVKKASLTPSFGQMLVDFENSSDFISVARELSEIATEWDMDYNGEPFPPSFDNLRRLPMPFLAAFIRAITEQWSGKPKMSKVSGNGSAQAAKQSE